jgi:hypothetical protein
MGQFDRCFKFPRDGEFSIPAEWWIEAGMEGFERGSEASYRFAPPPEAFLVLVEDIAPPNMDGRQHLDHGGFDHERMVDVLRNIASRSAMHPIEIVERQQGAYRYHLYHGYHRFHASVAAGFSYVPTLWDWIPETQALNALP